MAVKIRLSRIGKKNRPYWRIVAVDSQKKRDGACLENLGAYDPLTHNILQLHRERVEHWIANGAVCSPTVKKLIKKSKSQKA